MLALVLCGSTFFGCGESEAKTEAVTYSADYTADELKEFHSKKMESVYSTFEEVKAEIAKWDSFSEPDQLVESLNVTVLVKIEEILKMLEGIKTDSPEVTELKSMYVSAMETYKLGYSGINSAFESGEDQEMYDAYAVLEEGVKLLEVYDEKLDELSENYDLDI